MALSSLSIMLGGTPLWTSFPWTFWFCHSSSGHRVKSKRPIPLLSSCLTGLFRPANGIVLRWFSYDFLILLIFSPVTGSVLATVAASGCRPYKEIRFWVSGGSGIVCAVDATTRLLCQPILYKRKGQVESVWGLTHLCGGLLSAVISFPWAFENRYWSRCLCDLSLHSRLGLFINLGCIMLSTT